MADANSGPKRSNSVKRPKRTAVTDETQLLHIVTKYFKYAGVTLAVWFFGWARLSPSWLLLGLVLVLWKERHVKQKHKRMKMQQQMADNEKEVILATVDDLPSWVNFPDVERAEWINKILDQVWPFIGDYVRDLLLNSIQQKIQSSHAQAASFKFIKIDLGDVPPRIGGVKVFTKNVKRDEIYMDLDLMYASDTDIVMKVKGMTMGVKDLHIRGIMRVVLRPLIGRMPLFGGVSVYFLNNPEIDFNLTGVANAIDMPGLSDMVDTIIQEQIAAIMVLPNRIDVPMVEDLKAIARLKYPLPDGVLRIYMIEAKDLIKADIGVLKKGLSDPYGVIRLGANKFKTPVINNTVTPVWNSVFETIIDAKDGQFLDVEVRDEDPGSKDDSLGTLTVPVVNAAEKGTDDAWLPLEDVKSGLVHMKLVWMYLSKDPLILDKTIKEVEARDKLHDDLSSCLLMVNLDSARELPIEQRGRKHMAEPSPFVKLTLGQAKEESVIRADTDEPRWEQNFRFLVHNPNLQKLELEVIDSKTKNAIGNLKVPLKSLLSEQDMTVDKFYNLVNSGPNSQVRMRLCLRILSTEYVPEMMEDEEEEEIETLTGSESSVDPPKTPDSSSVPAKPDAKPGDKPAIKKEEVVKVERNEKVANKPPEGQLIPPMDTSTPIKDADLRQRKGQSASPTANQGGLFGRGRIQLTFRYSTQRQKLVVVIHKCVNLMPCDTNDNLADPYIKVYLLPDKKDKKKTQTIKNTLNPVFDETFEFTVSQTELAGRTLELSVKNDTSFYSSNKKFIGITQVKLDNMDQSKAATLWFDLQPDEDDCKPVSLPSETDI